MKKIVTTVCREVLLFCAGMIDLSLAGMVDLLLAGLAEASDTG